MIDFSKGIFGAGFEGMIPDGFYREAWNIRGTSGARKTLEGNSRIPATDSLVVNGSCIIEDEVIILGSTTTGDDTYSFIGVIYEDNTYEELVATSGFTYDVLGIVEPIMVEGRVDWEKNRLIYFSTDQGARRINLGPAGGQSPIATNLGPDVFDKQTSLFLEYELPITKYKGETLGGSLNSGVYQFFVRLVSESGASTSFGLNSGVISVFQDFSGSQVQDIQGNEPQTPTSKAINLEIQNLDTTFDFFQIGILTYVGLANTPVVTVTEKLALTNEVESYTYRGAIDDVDTLTLIELIASGVAYTSARLITQKDSTLLIAGPKEAEQPDIDWFAMAANIESKYEVQDMAYSDNVNVDVKNPDEYDQRRITATVNINTPRGSYADPSTIASKRGYRRGEIYSFQFTPVFASGVLGPTVHIPARDTGSNNEDYPAQNNVLGTHYSNVSYPNSPEFSGNGMIGPIRYHKMPTIEEEPIVASQSNGARTSSVRIIGVKFSGFEVPSEYVDLVQGFIITRTNRTGQETQLAQGIARPMFRQEAYNDQNYSEDLMTIGDGFTTYTQYVNGLDDRDIETTVYSPIMTTQYGDSLKKNSIITNFSFLAPDIIHGLYNETEGTHIKQSYIYKCDPYLLHRRSAQDAPAGVGMQLDEEGDNFRNITHEMTMAFFKDVTGPPTQQMLDEYNDYNAAIQQSTIQLDSNKKFVGAFGVPKQNAAGGGKENTFISKDDRLAAMASSDGFVWMSSVQGLPYYRPGVNMAADVQANGRGLMWNQSMNQDNCCLYLNTVMFTQGSNRKEYSYAIGDVNADYSLVVHTLTRESFYPYGSLSNQVGQFIGFLENDGEDNVNGVTLFNGDTFISKYGLTVNDEAKFNYLSTDNKGEQQKYNDQRMYPPNSSGVIYFWLESNNNYNLRHFVEPESYSTGNISSSGTVPFFPAYSVLLSNQSDVGILNLTAVDWPRPGYASRYNNQYSISAGAKAYAITPPKDTKSNREFTNRILYSSTAVEGEKLDAYQFFGINNYTDIPLSRGVLQDLFVGADKELYTATPQVIWRTFYNTLATQSTSAGEIVLGNGGAFNRPPIELTVLDGGYAGISHFSHRAITPLGVIFVDSKSGIIFKMGEGMQPMSSVLGIKFKDQLRELPNDQIRVGVDAKYDLAFIRYGDRTVSMDYTTGTFPSFHSMAPSLFISRGQDMFSFNSDTSKEVGLFIHNVPFVNTLYGDRFSSSISLVHNDGPDMSKVYRVMKLISNLRLSNGNTIHNKTITSVKFYNRQRNTGAHDVKIKSSFLEQPGFMEVLTERTRDEFRIAIPRDRVINPDLAVLDPSNLHGENAKFLQKMRGNYMIVDLEYDNSEGQIYFINVDFELDLNNR